MKIIAAVSRLGVTAPVLQELELHEPQNDEIRVRMVATGVCHTDITAHSGVLAPLPIVLGHEGAGIVEAVGDHVTELIPGDHVVLSGSSCGHCPGCINGQPVYCDTATVRAFGGGRLDSSSSFADNGEHIQSHFFGQSSFATRVIAPERTAVKVDRAVPLEKLGPLGCGVITGAGAVIEELALRPHNTFAVFGVGGVGLSAVMAAHLSGLRTIIAVDRSEERLALAKEMGATDVIHADDDDVAAKIKMLTGRGVDATLNTTTVPSVFTAALDCLAVRGTAAFVAAPRGDWHPPMFSILSRGRILKGILGGSANPRVLIPALIEHWQQGRFPFDRLLTFYPFQHIEKAFEDLRSGKVIKPVLHIKETSIADEAAL